MEPWSWGDMDLDLLELAAVRRCGGSRGVGSSTLLVDLLPQPAAAEGMSCALVIGARYIEWIAACTELGLEVARWLPPPRLDPGDLVAWQA
jgi:hypothetical protein